MKDKKKRIKTKILIKIFLLIFFSNLNFIAIGTSKSTIFTNNLEMGTQIIKVSYYNEQAWKNSVTNATDPREWFGGQADKVGAKYKLTIIDKKYNENVSSNYIFLNFVFPEKAHELFPNVSKYGYGYYLFNNYTYQYLVWRYYFYYWNFTTGEFNVFQNSTYYSDMLVSSFIIQDPLDYKKMLVDYNDFAGKINNDTTLQSLNISFPILTGDDLVWQFIISRIAVAAPINDYLTTMIEVLNCTNTTVRGNTLIFKKHGVQNYTVEVTYGRYGTVSSFIIKDLDNHIIYKIESFYPSDLFLLIIGIIIAILTAIIIYITLRKRKQLNLHKLSIEELKLK